jgi:3D (Asp-Asp-Asp) domain-containing protein
MIQDLSLAQDTVYIPDPEMTLDQQRVIEPGKEGILARLVRVRYEDDIKVSEAILNEWTSRSPRARVIAYGTQVIIRSLQTPSGTFDYWRKLHVLATSYSPLTAGHKQPGDPFFGVSATGAEVVRGIIATDPRVIPLGTGLYVPDYGLGKALDVGGAVKGFRIDLGYDDANLVLWNTWVDVYLLVPVPAPDEMIWVLPG